MRNAGHLDVEAELFGPEPGLLAGFHRLAQHGERSGAALRFRIGPAFQPDTRTGNRFRIERAIACREDIRIRGAAGHVDDDAASQHGQAGLLRQFGIGDGADAGHHQIGGQVAAISKGQCRSLAGAPDRLDLCAQPEGNPLRFGERLKSLAQRRRQDA